MSGTESPNTPKDGAEVSDVVEIHTPFSLNRRETLKKCYRNKVTPPRKLEPTTRTG